MAKVKTGSIDDITPEQWDEMNRLHLEEMAAQREEAVNIEYDTCEDIGFPSESYSADTQTFTISMNDVTSGYDNYVSFNPEDVTISFVPEPVSIDYKFREDELIAEFKNYIDSTYSAHYGQGGLQSSEVIIDRGHGMGFFSGNVDKYNGRYGKKGEPADHRKDIMKIIHYGFLMLFEHDRIHGDTSN